ncbi:phytoene/squalene synthase family protein [bacterium]|nr:phytoene/squalene synthase family protein [bacterium]
MKQLFDQLSYQFSKDVTHAYSTSFSMAVGMLAPAIRPAIHSIYGFVRFADEIVDTFHEYDKKSLITRFEEDVELAIIHKISLNPVLNSFQETVHKYGIEMHLIDSFMKSMKMDLHKEKYKTEAEYNEYIYGSADVVGLMCLKVFVNGDNAEYERLKAPAMRLGSAFQKVNFLRDIKDDIELLNRSYFPNVDFNNLNNEVKDQIIAEIEADFASAYEGIIALPPQARFGVYTAYIYYKQLLNKLKKTPSTKILDTRIRVPNSVKLGLMAKSYVSTKLNLL